MTMKKILAGVLASASVMAMSASAFAVEAPETTKAITKPGETEYEAGVSVMSAELDVELPAQMKAFINPYGAEVTIGVKDADDVKSSDGIISWAYEVVNNTADFGIMIDVKKAKATVSNGVSLLEAAPGKTGAKSVLIELKSGADAAAVKYADADTKSAAATASAGGKVILKAEEQNQAKFAYAPAKNATTGAGKTYIGIVGALEKGDPTASPSVADPEWTDEDSITCSYILKINPAKKTAAAAFA